MKSQIKSIARKIINAATACLLIFSLFLFFTVKHADAQAAGVPNGGFAILSLPCTCTGAGTWWAVLFPFYEVGAQPSMTELVYQYGQFKYFSYYFMLGQWEIGFYQPGYGQCEIGYDPYCYSLTNSGTITADTGSSPL